MPSALLSLSICLSRGGFVFAAAPALGHCNAWCHLQGRGLPGSSANAGGPDGQEPGKAAGGRDEVRADQASPPKSHPVSSARPPSPEPTAGCICRPLVPSAFALGAQSQSAVTLPPSAAERPLGSETADWRLEPSAHQACLRGPSAAPAPFPVLGLPMHCPLHGSDHLSFNSSAGTLHCARASMLSSQSLSVKQLSLSELLNQLWWPCPVDTETDAAGAMPPQGRHRGAPGRC